MTSTTSPNITTTNANNIRPGGVGGGVAAEEPLTDLQKQRLQAIEEKERKSFEKSIDEIGQGVDRIGFKAKGIHEEVSLSG